MVLMNTKQPAKKFGLDRSCHSVVVT